MEKGMSQAASPTRIVFLDRDTMPADIDLRPFTFPYVLRDYGSTAPEQVAERIAGAEIVITNKAPVRADAIAGATNLRLVAIAATGSDIVDVAACAKKGVVVSNIAATRSTRFRNIPSR